MNSLAGSSRHADGPVIGERVGAKKRPLMPKSDRAEIVKPLGLPSLHPFPQAKGTQHAYDVSAALTYVKDGTILPHYQQ